MKVGIIVHSKSGKTFLVARAIAEKFSGKNISAEVIRLKPQGEIHPGSKKITISEPPSLDSFDTIIFGGPVWAFNASPVITTFLKSTGNLNEKKLLCFITMGFPIAFLGGKQAINTMNKILSKSGGTIFPGEVFTSLTIANKQKRDTLVEQIINKLQ